jgi:hypothetical protein
VGQERRWLPRPKASGQRDCQTTLSEALPLFLSGGVRTCDIQLSITLALQGLGNAVIENLCLSGIILDLQVACD